MLDEQHALAHLHVDPPDQPLEVQLLRRVRAGGRLVEQQQLRIGAERAGDLEPTLSAVGQGDRKFVRPPAQTNELEQFEGAFVTRAVLPPRVRQPQHRAQRAGAPARLQPDLDVLERGERVEQPDVLEGARDAEQRDPIRFAAENLRLTPVLVPQDDRAFLRVVDAGHAVEQRRLAGTVGSDHGEDLAALLGQGDIRETGHPAEAQRDPVDAQDRVVDRALGGHVGGRGHGASPGAPIASAPPTPASASPSSRERRRDGRMPCGRKIIMITSSAPM